MIVSGVDGETADPPDELRHESGGPLLGAPGLGSLALADFDHDITSLGDLKERLDEGALVAGITAVFKGVEVAPGGAGAGPAAAPAALAILRGAVVIGGSSLASPALEPDGRRPDRLLFLFLHFPSSFHSPSP